MWEYSAPPGGLWTTEGECPECWTRKWVEPRQGDNSRRECRMTPEAEEALREANRNAAEKIISGQER